VVPGRVLGSEGLVGIRPEQIEVLTRAEPGAVEATVEQAELTGAETWVTLLVGGESMVARASPDFARKQGERAWLRFPSDRVLRFGPDGQTRL